MRVTALLQLLSHLHYNSNTPIPHQVLVRDRACAVQGAAQAPVATKVLSCRVPELQVVKGKEAEEARERAKKSSQ